MSEPVEELDLGLAVPANGMVVRQALDQLADAGAELVGKVRSRRADEGVDVRDGRLGHGGESLAARAGSVGCMRRPRPIELMLLAVIVLWSLNITVTRYILTHGFEPLAYATVRYGLATAIFLAITLVAERTLRVARRDWLLVGAAALVLWLNQLAFVYALDTTAASTIGLLLGATPVFAALLGLALGTERPSGRFWLGAAVSFCGVALVGLGAGGEIEGGTEGIVLGIATAASWAAYSVAIAPLMRRYSPYRISALVLLLGWVLIAATGGRTTVGQDLGVGWEVWLLLVFATVGPLVTTNVLWFRSVDRIGPARATLAANLQPFVAAVVALVLLSESMTVLQVAGGVLIGGGIALARRRGTPVPAE
jgi:drug/metabolite transporter (DMT)-like permease